MDYTELYKKAMGGDFYAFDEIKKQADVGNAEAQYLLYCICDNMSGPFRDVERGMTWLKKSAENGHPEAQNTYNSLSPEERVKYHIEKEGDIDKVFGTIKSGGMFSFEGRISRKTYIIYFLSYIVFFLLCGLVLINNDSSASLLKIIDVLMRIVGLYLVCALVAKRSHDCGHSGMWGILIPFVWIVLFFKKGEKGTNRYGAEPE